MNFWKLLGRVFNLFFWALPFLNGCAVLHHYQVADIDNRNGYVQVPFDIKLTEVGVDAKQVGQTADILTRNKDRNGEKLGGYIEMFQMGPRTGLPVYSTKWIDQVMYKVYESCPSGRVTGLASIREHRNYGGISGEVVRITGFCLKPKT